MNNWERLRQKVLQRDDHTCSICGRNDRPLDVHHRIPRILFKDDELDNLMTVCYGDCHEIADSWIFDTFPKTQWSNPTRKSIKIKDETHARLTKYGNILDSFDDVLNKLMDKLEKKK